MGACARPLSPAEIAVGGGGAAFAWRHHVAVDADAHGAAGFAPLETCGAEDTVEPFLLGLALPSGRAGRHQPGNPAHPASQDRGSCAQILAPRNGAAGGAAPVDREIAGLLAGL